MISHAFIARFVPVVAFLVLIEEVAETSLIIRSFLPNVAVADFIKQQSVVIFAYKVSHVRVGCRKLFCALVE